MRVEVSTVLIGLACFLLTSLLVLYVYVTSIVYRYFEEKGIPFDKPFFPFGSFTAAAAFRKSFPSILVDMHRANKRKKLVGFFAFWMKSILVIDPEIIRSVLVKGFDSFDDRGMYYNKENDPLSAHLFSLDGKEWRSLRAKISPTFSSRKIKGMFSNISACADEMNMYLLNKKSSHDEVDFKAIFSRFGISVISTTAFGLDSDAFTNEESIFVKMALKMFATTVERMVQTTILFNISIAKALRMRYVPEVVSDFFRSTVKRTIDLRRTSGIVRNDYLQLLINLKDSKDSQVTLSEDEVAAESFVFVLAGFETTSSTMSFCLYELALNPELQQRVIQEVDSVTDLTYDAINSMEYLDMVVDETLRKYPPVPFLVRRCKEDYLVPGTNTVIERGTQVYISSQGIQNDPDLFPEPDRFIPERFSKENKPNIKPYSYIPFGEGPRYCIGARFGKLVVKTGLASLLRQFEVSRAPLTPHAIAFDPRAVTLTAKGGVWLRLLPRAQRTL